jgi:hypothetical protein
VLFVRFHAEPDRLCKQLQRVVTDWGLGMVRWSAVRQRRMGLLPAVVGVPPQRMVIPPVRWENLRCLDNVAFVALADVQTAFYPN